MAPSGFSETAISRENEEQGTKFFSHATIFHRLTRITAAVTRVSNPMHQSANYEMNVEVEKGEGWRAITGSDGK